jgi:hypothetical protein
LEGRDHAELGSEPSHGAFELLVRRRGSRVERHLERKRRIREAVSDRE